MEIKINIKKWYLYILIGLVVIFSGLVFALALDKSEPWHSADQIAGGNIVIETGTVAHGETIPVPGGYTRDQCKWVVSRKEGLPDTEALFWDYGNKGRGGTLNVWADGNGKVTCYSEFDIGPYYCNANYIIICKK